jgi:DNA (cytosine-5)-methyltransferase 1
MKLKILDLFSGIGGFSLGLEATGHFETAAFCEIEPYCKQVLKKHWPTVPIFDDIRQLKGTDIGTIDIITGGYPCQPFSVAGKQKAEQDPRHLWPEYFRLIQELRPTWVIGENVSGHIKLGLDSVLEDLASEGYSTRTFSISASSIGANHKRERVWTVAYSGSIANAMRGIDNSLSKESRSWSYYEGRGRGNANGISHPSTNERLDSKDVENSRRTLWQRGQFSKENEDEIGKENANQFERSSSTSKIDVANTDSKRQQEQWRPISVERQRKEGQELECKSWWESEPRVGRVAHGIPKRVDRLKTLGNAVVPHIPYYIGQAIVESYQ